MKNLWAVALLSVSSVIMASDYTTDNGQYKVGISLTGGAIDSLRNYSGKPLHRAGSKSFVERFFTVQDGKMLVEKFHEYEYSLDSSNYNHRKNADITLSAKGVACFDWLRVTKKYNFNWNKVNFTIQYTLKNTDSQPHKAGVWIQTFLNIDEGAAIFQPQAGKIVEITHPGSARSDEWSLNPGLALTGISGKSDKYGMVLSVTPAENFAGTYSWCGNINGQPANTLELLTREMVIAPGAEVSFTVNAHYYNNVRGYMRSLAKKPEFKINTTALSNINQLPHLTLRASAMTQPQRYVDVKVNRQYFDSIRSIVIPADEKISRAAAYIVMNKLADIDRPLPSRLIALPDGSKRLLFAVPGIAPRGALYSRVINGMVYDVISSKNVYLKGKKELTVRIALDAPTDSPELKAEQPEMAFNGNFEIPNKNNNFAEGNLWHEQTLNRKLAFWEKGGKDGSYCIRIKREGPKGTAAYTQQFLAEPGRKYTVSADIKCENPDKKYIICYVDCFDDNDKFIAKSKIVYSDSKASHDWKRVSRTFSVPANAARLRLAFQLSPAGVENTMWVDNVSLVAEDFSFKAKPALTAAREDAVYSGYAPLANLEKISHEYVTVHEKWFKPAAFKLPKLLYGCSIIKTNEDASRREIVELAQRMDLDYEFIPLLPTIEDISGKGAYGVHSVKHGSQMTDYTLERFRALKQAPEVVIIQAVNFKTYDQNKTLTAEIAKLQSQGSRVIFLDCLNTPGELLGKAEPLPPEWLQLPVMQKGKANRHMRKYAKADFFMFGDAHYTQLDNMPSTPAEIRSMRSPAYISRDFPYWEYRYLPLAKAIRSAAGVKVPVITGNSQSGSNLTLKINAPTDCSGQIAVEFKSVNRELDGRIKQDVKLKSGMQEVTLPLPPLPGGVHIAHIQLLDAQNKVLDAAAMRFDTPITAQTAIRFAAANRIYQPGQPVEFTVGTTNFQAGDKLLVSIEDTNFRTVYQAEKNSSQADFSVNLQAPYTILYRIFAKVVRNGQLIGRSMEEFSVPGRKLDHTDFHAGMWGGRLLLSNMLRNYGFDLLSCDGRRDNIQEGTLRNITNLGLYPLILNLSWVANDTALNLKYRADIASDPVRVPCYSDPAVTAAAEKGLAELTQNNQFNYYNGLYHMLGDEMFLGSSVCYSEHCLKGFREYLQKQYKSIAELNRVWNSSFKDFADVVPVQRKVVENSDNLAPWLDHKMFMVNVWAHNFVGKRIEFIRNGVPGAQVGMSGTQVPGYSYDWAQLMKHLSCTAYYNGVQTTLVNQWQHDGSLSGQWGGGYVCSSKVYDIYQKSYQWSNLIKGANMVWNWHGSAYNGDGSPTENLKSYCEEFNLLKSGLAKLVLSADKNNAEIAVLYSQNSMFTAMAGGIGQAEWQNTQTGWEELLLDLKLDARFITYEELADSKFDLSKFKIIILPLSLALSDAERERLVQFAEKGGTVIADALPGRYDSHGKRISGTVLDKLFPPNRGKIAPQMQNLNQAILKGRFRVAEPDLELIKITSCGKGRGVLLNVMLSSYQSLAIGGAGGETATAASGSQAYCLAMRQLISQLAQASSVAAHAAITDSKGQLTPSQSVLKKSGLNHYLAVVRHTDLMKTGKIDHQNAPVLQVKLPVTGVIYDVRQGKLIARGNQFTIKAPAGYGQLFAILPDEITAMTAQVPAAVKAGEMVKVTCRAKGAQSRTVYRLEVTDPRGNLCREYSLNSCFETPDGEFAFQIPYNAPTGQWQVKLQHTASGQSVSKKLAVNAN